MKRFLCGFLAVTLVLSQGNGTTLWAAGRAKKKPAETTASVPLPPAVELRGIRVQDNRVRISLNQLPPYKISLLQNPAKLVIDLSGTINKTASEQASKGDLFDRIRVEQSGEGATLVSHLVFDLLQNVDYETHTTGSDILLTLHPNPAAGARGGNSWDLLGNLPRENVDMDFEGEDVRNVLRLLGEQSKINITFGPEVAGSVTLHLKSVPFDQAFRTVLSMNNLVARQMGDNILWIMTPASLTQSRTSADTTTRTIILNYAKADEVKTNLDQIRNAAGRKGTTLIDARTNSITLMDTEEGLDEAQRLISLVDKKPVQIMIEARLVEIDLDNSLDLGIQWGATSGFQSNGTNYGIGTTQINSSPTNAFNNSNSSPNGILNGSAGNYSSPTSPASTTSPSTGVNLPAAATAGAITFGFVNNTASLIATINAMASKNKSRVLSAPKIVTLNSEEAKIEADQQIPYPITTVTGTGVSQQSFQFVSAGIILTVTPTVNADGQVMMKINPVASFPIAGLTSVGPTIQTRSAMTTVLVKDGQTIVIGGMINETDTNNIQKVPLFGDIPILGAFFRHQLKEKNRTELLVFVTPHIIKD